MLRIQSIDSLAIPALAPYRTLRQSDEHRRKGIFVCQGEKVVGTLLGSELSLVSILATAEWLERLRPELEARRELIEVYLGGKELLQEVTGHSMYQPILAVARIPRPPTVASILLNSRRPYFLVALDGVGSAENMGAIVRSCAAFEVDGLLVSGTSCSPYLRRSVRSSMGGIFHLPAVDVPDLGSTIRDLQSQGIPCIAAHPHATGRSIEDIDFKGDVCVVLGSEGEGISPAVLAACAGHAAIPISERVDSLNVAGAATAFLYEVRRQRRASR